MRFFTENDSEVIGVYLADQLENGPVARGRADAVARRLRWQFHVSRGERRREFGYARDPFALKPLIIVDTTGLRGDRERGGRDPVRARTGRRGARAERPCPADLDRWRGGSRCRSLSQLTIDCQDQPIRAINKAIRDGLAAGTARQGAQSGAPATISASGMVTPGDSLDRRERGLLLRRDDGRGDDPRGR